MPSSTTTTMSKTPTLCRKRTRHQTVHPAIWTRSPYGKNLRRRGPCPPAHQRARRQRGARPRASELRPHQRHRSPPSRPATMIPSTLIKLPTHLPTRAAPSCAARHRRRPRRAQTLSRPRRWLAPRGCRGTRSRPRHRRRCARRPSRHACRPVPRLSRPALRPVSRLPRLARRSAPRLSRPARRSAPRRPRHRHRCVPRPSRPAHRSAHVQRPPSVRECPSHRTRPRLRPPRHGPPSVLTIHLLRRLRRRPCELCRGKRPLLRPRHLCQRHRLCGSGRRTSKPRPHRVALCPCRAAPARRRAWRVVLCSLWCYRRAILLCRPRRRHARTGS